MFSISIQCLGTSFNNNLSVWCSSTGRSHHFGLALGSLRFLVSDLIRFLAFFIWIESIVDVKSVPRLIIVGHRSDIPLILHFFLLLSSLSMNIFLTEYIIWVRLFWRCFLFSLSLFLLHLLFRFLKLLGNIDPITDWRKRHLVLFLHFNSSRTFLPVRPSIRFSIQT